MKIKKQFLLFLAMVMILTMPVLTFASDENQSNALYLFSDMPNNWSTIALKHAVENGLLTGLDGKLKPNDELTRAQMATIIVRAFGALSKGDLKDFSDIKPTDWYADSLAKAFQMGVLKGSNGKMYPNNPITREEAFVILARALKLSPSETVQKTFSDADTISNWAKGEVYAMINHGYIQGFNGQLNPKTFITRAEFAQIMDNILIKYMNKPGEYTEVSDGNIMINAPGISLKNLEIKGDLIIGDGVGNGEVILDNVKISGRMVVRGGGMNSIIIRGASDISNIILSRIDGAVRIKIQGNSNVEIINIEDGSDDVFIEGTVENIKVNASNITVTIRAVINGVQLLGENTKLVIDTNASVKKIEIAKSASNTNIDVFGTVQIIETSGLNTYITGTGDVDSVQVYSGADYTSIRTPGTKIIVDTGVVGITGCRGTYITSGTTVNNNSSCTGIVTVSDERSPTKIMNITDFSITDSTTISFLSDVAGAKIKWNNILIKDGLYNKLTVEGANTITVPAMLSEESNTLSIQKSEYKSFTKIDIIWISVDTITISVVGDVSIVEKGQTLQMNAVILPVNATNNKVIWSVEPGSGSASIDSDTGFLTAAGTGTIIVQVAASDGSSVNSSKEIKIYPESPNYTINYFTEKTNEIVPVLDEYSIDYGISWTAGPGTQFDVTPKQDVWFRVAATDGIPAGSIQTLVVPARPDTPSYTVDFREESINGFSSSDLYSLDGFSTSGISPGDGDLSLTASLSPNAPGGTTKILSIKTEVTDHSFESEVQVLSIPARLSNTGVNNYTIDFVAETTNETVPITEEYSLNGGITWTSGNSSKASLIPGANTYFRLSSTGGNFASEFKTLSVPVRPAYVPTFSHAIGGKDTLYGLPPSGANLEVRIFSGGVYSAWDNMSIDDNGQAIFSHDGGDLVQVRLKAATGTNFAGDNTEQYSKMPVSYLSIGDLVMDGTWQWSTKPVTWIVVAENHYTTDSIQGITLLSKDIIGNLVFDNRTEVHWGGYNHWGTSSHIRPWLNSTGSYAGTGFYNTFSNPFKNVVLTTNVPNKPYNSNSSYISSDKVFIPSVTELGDDIYKSYTDYNTGETIQYIITYEIGNIFPFFIEADNTDRIAKLGLNNTPYWTRSPYKNLKDIVICYLSDGSKDDSRNGQAIKSNGVRPALTISPDVLVSGTPNANGVYEIFYE